MSSTINDSGIVKQMAIWTFDTLNLDGDDDDESGSGSGTTLPIKTENLRGTPSLQMFYQDIDDDGKAGIAYTDIAGVTHTAGRAAAWDDIRGDGPDAELLLKLDSRDWNNISLRFDYQSDSANSFDVEYSTNGGTNWTKSLDNAPLTPGGSWRTANIDLTTVTAIENQSSVQIRINDLARNGNNEFRFDNFEVVGETTVTNPAGTISLSTPYSENFDSLAASGTGNAWSDANTLEGWYSNRTTYNAGSGTSTTGALYSFGSTGSSDRALGSLASDGTGQILTGARFYNDTNTTLSSLSLSYTGEQWRNGGNTTPQKLDFAYQIGATNLTGGTWTNIDALDFTGPVATNNSGGLNGNNNRVDISGTLSGFSLAPGQEIWLRWSDANDAGNDHGLAIDNLQVTKRSRFKAPSFTTDYFMLT